jgi:hypothetical protein
LPSRVWEVSGDLPKRDSSPEEAAHALKWKEGQWPEIADEDMHSSYRDKFKNGATIFPRMLCVVKPVESGPLGGNINNPLVESRRTPQEKKPWKDLPTLRGNIESEFLYPLFLGESIAPFRVLKPVLAILSWENNYKKLLNSENANNLGYTYLGKWLANVENLWTEYGQAGMTFTQQMDYFGKLSAQFPINRIRVVYSKAGTLPAAALISDVPGIIENKLYWTSVVTKHEGYYLLAILNSETTRKRSENLQSRGQWGARDFDKVMFSLPIPQFNPKKKLHLELVEAARHAEEVASAVQLTENMNFIRARQTIRVALQEDGVSAKIDKMVVKLLDSNI